VLQHVVAAGYLAVSSHHHLAVAPYANDGRGADFGTLFQFDPLALNLAKRRRKADIVHAMQP
jgi:hypothetical protein